MFTYDKFKIYFSMTISNFPHCTQNRPSWGRFISHESTMILQTLWVHPTLYVDTFVLQCKETIISDPIPLSQQHFFLCKLNSLSIGYSLEIVCIVPFCSYHILFKRKKKEKKTVFIYTRINELWSVWNVRNRVHLCYIWHDQICVHSKVIINIHNIFFVKSRQRASVWKPLIIVCHILIFFIVRSTNIRCVCCLQINQPALDFKFTITRAFFNPFFFAFDSISNLYTYNKRISKWFVIR